MKKKEYTIEDSFIATCKSLITSGGRHRPLRVNTLLAEALAMRPEHHFVEFSTALRAMYLVRRQGDEAVFKRSSSRHRWREMYTQVRTVLARHPSYTFPQAVAYTLTNRRPSRYYIPLRVARALLLRAVSELNVTLVYA